MSTLQELCSVVNGNIYPDVVILMVHFKFASRVYFFWRLPMRSGRDVLNCMSVIIAASFGSKYHVGNIYVNVPKANSLISLKQTPVKVIST